MVVSDTHFRHKKLCFGEAEHFDRTRNYKFTSDMDADIITQWNKNIGDNDVVIFLGDFLMNTPEYTASKIIESIWSDIQDRSSGEIVRKEDSVNLLDPDDFIAYVRKIYKFKFCSIFQ